MTKAIIGTLVFISFYALLVWTLYNILSGCALVNDWGHSDCMTPLDLIRG